VRWRSILLVAALVATSCSGDDDTGEPTSTDPDTSTANAPSATAPTEPVATSAPEDTPDPPSGPETTERSTTADPTTTSPPTTTEAPTDERMAPEALGEAQARWEAAGVDSYDFTIRYTTEFLHGTYRVSVRDGVAVSAERVPPRAGVDWLTESELPTTIDEVFDRVERDVAAPVFEVGFDDELGYPTHVFADPLEGVVDDELEFFIEDFADRTAAN
jgi:hypothetical protein